jgi:hypothetical protein
VAYAARASTVVVAPDSGTKIAAEHHTEMSR